MSQRKLDKELERKRRHEARAQVRHQRALLRRQQKEESTKDLAQHALMEK